MLSIRILRYRKFNIFLNSNSYWCIKFLIFLVILFNQHEILVNGLRATMMTSGHHNHHLQHQQQNNNNNNNMMSTSYSDGNNNMNNILTNSIQRRNTNSNISFNNNNGNINNNNYNLHSDGNNNNINNNNNYYHSNNNVNSMNIMTDSSSSCQTVCVCKWKGGKQTVECIDRALITIPEIDQSTQVLDMSGNNLQILPHEQFIRANLLNLQKLYLRNCRIGQIDADAFKGLTNLVELDLSHNLLTSVPSQTLIYTPSLRDLILSSNPIQKIEGYTFRNIPSLHKLDLSHCDIQSIAPQAFEGLDSLLMLKLNGNKLSELRPRTVETLSKLHGVELHDNPWMCDCRLRAAKIWLTERNIPYPVAPVCSGGPERVINRTFADLQIDDFACRPEILPTSRYVESTTGENATIVCRTSAVPTANVNWYWNGRQIANGSIFSSYQKVYIYEDGQFEKRSKLILTNSQETDSSEFYCVAENRAGTAEANFTLHVSMRAAGMASLGSGQIVGLSAALVILILFILLIILFLLVRLRRTPFIESKTPNHLEVITTVNQRNGVNCKQAPPSSNSMSAIQTGNGGLPTGIDINGLDQKNNTNCNEPKETNPVQKPPRLTDLPYSSGNCDNNLMSSGSCFISPTASAGNNPDLINDTKRFGSGDFADLKIPPISTSNCFHDTSSIIATSTIERPGSGEYSRAGGCDSLYPSGLWETGSPNHADDLYLKRATSTTLSAYKNYTDKTPIIDNAQSYDLHDRTMANDFFSKTFPRTHFTNLSTGSSSTIGVGGANSTTSTTTTLSSSTGGNGGASSGNFGVHSGGYPSDYGLPLVPGAEQQLQHHLPIHYQQQQQLINNNNNSSFNNGINNNNSSSHNKINNGTMSSTSVSSSIVLPNGMPVNAKTIRVWQKGGVPVLPPVTALKRALTSNSRNSPDEGYQEGCGTDV